MNPEQARFNMVEQQIRPWNVLDTTVLDLLFTVKRENFVPPAYRSLAFADLEIPLTASRDPGKRMWAPKIEARVLQDLRLLPSDEVLEIGTGSGYFAALLAHRAARVTSVEIDPALAESARARLAANGVTNVEVSQGDGARGWRGGQLFDVIVLTGSTPVLADAFFAQLKPNGRLFAIVGAEPAMHGTLHTRGEAGSIGTRELFETVVAPLVNAPQPERFVF